MVFHREMDPGLEEAIATILWASPHLVADIQEMREVSYNWLPYYCSIMWSPFFRILFKELIVEHECHHSHDHWAFNSLFDRQIQKQLTNKYSKEYVDMCLRNGFENVNEQVGFFKFGPSSHSLVHLWVVTGNHSFPFLSGDAQDVNSSTP